MADNHDAAGLPNMSGAGGWDLTDDQRTILDQADRFGRAELHGLSQRMDDEEWWPEDAFGQIGAPRILRHHGA